MVMKTNIDLSNFENPALGNIILDIFKNILYMQRENTFLELSATD